MGEGSNIEELNKKGIPLTWDTEHCKLFIKWLPDEITALKGQELILSVPIYLLA